MKVEQESEVLNLAIFPYQHFIKGDPELLKALRAELYENGIIGIKGIPGYQAKVQSYLQAARAFTALPEIIKDAYAPDRSQGSTFLGYESGKEKFQRADGQWVVDNLKISYYGIVPDNAENTWPTEVDLKTPFQELGILMAEMGVSVLEKIGLVGTRDAVVPKEFYFLGRMLYYKGVDDPEANPVWNGPHFDHGLFTALIPAYYYIKDELVSEPSEAGLFVNTQADGNFKKVISNDPDVMMFQVGEFAQLASNDAIRATEHTVQKAKGIVDRYAMALFIDPAMDVTVHSTSALTQDPRYGGKAGDPCSYQHWHEETFKRSIVVDE